jgi:hypothetical protein
MALRMCWSTVEGTLAGSADQAEDQAEEQAEEQANTAAPICIVNVRMVFLTRELSGIAPALILPA